MRTEQGGGEELFSRLFIEIERIIEAVAARQRLSPGASQELYSQVMLKIVEHDFAVLYGFRGKSSWSTYLTVVVHRVLLDYRTKEWGRWRPCAAARRLGPVAVELDRWINRDGLTAPEAIRQVMVQSTEETEEELERLVAQLPRRPRRRFTSVEASLKNQVGTDRAERRVEFAERRHTVEKLRATLGAALRELSSPERTLLGLRFGRGWTVQRIATSQNLQARRLYRQFDHILRRLRRRLERLGLRWSEVAAVLENPDLDLEIELG